MDPWPGLDANSRGQSGSQAGLRVLRSRIGRELWCQESSPTACHPAMSHPPPPALPSPGLPTPGAASSSLPVPPQRTHHRHTGTLSKASLGAPVPCPAPPSPSPPPIQTLCLQIPGMRVTVAHSDSVQYFPKHTDSDALCTGPWRGEGPAGLLPTLTHVLTGMGVWRSPPEGGDSACCFHTCPAQHQTQIDSAFAGVATSRGPVPSRPDSTQRNPICLALPDVCRVGGTTEPLVSACVGWPLAPSVRA